MYNPYNWNIKEIENNNVEKKYKCILDELSNVGYELDAARIESVRLNKELSSCNREIIRLEKKRSSLLNLLAKTP